ncbi:transaldolase [Neisseria sp. Ec49-e6-T10]|uniref:transaldolase n=1 Tax=Neisseria sp. Ec49-e6-T10 TaxID=3140744 RepID=UPI003EB6CC7A
MANSNLKELKSFGQQIWLDSLSRSLIERGTLAQYLDLGVSGVTSNPTIFYQSIHNDTLYKDDVHWLKKQNLSAKERYEHLAIADIIQACDLLLPIYEQSGANAGFVSLEVSPKLSHDPEGTVLEAKRLWQKINRPNAMIKVPATAAGIIAITELISLGINVNVTLLFSRKQTLAVYHAYCTGLKIRQENGGKINTIKLVASFFLSRIDHALDQQLPIHIQGRTAISLAKVAYQDWMAFCSQPVFAQLNSLGAQMPSLLWASTTTKNPNYSDVMYLDNLIGNHTVNTVPEKTLQAFLDHGTAKISLIEGIPDAYQILDEVQKLGIDLEQLAEQLQKDGLEQFNTAFKQLLELLR